MSSLRRNLGLGLLGLVGVLIGAAIAGATTASAQGPRALVYCPASDSTPCNNIVSVLAGAGTYTGGIDRLWWSGSAASIRPASGPSQALTTSSNLGVYSVVIVPSLADAEYGGLRNGTVQGRLLAALTGRVAGWSGAPDQSATGNKATLIRNLAEWARGGSGTGLVFLLDLSTSGSGKDKDESIRYNWLPGIAGVTAAPELDGTSTEARCNKNYAVSPTGSQLPLSAVSGRPFGAAALAGLAANNTILAECGFALPATVEVVGGAATPQPQNILISFRAGTTPPPAPKTATALSVAAASGNFGGTAALSATLTAGGVGVSNKTIAFSLNGTSVGTGTTDASGVASIAAASLSGIAVGNYPNGVSASFTEDATHLASTGSASLTVVALNANPVASVGGPYSGNEGSPITLALGGSDADAGDVLSYSWNLGDGTTGSGATPPATHTYADNPAAPATTYTITLTVTDGKGGSDTKTTTVTVANVAPTATISAPGVDEGSAITVSLSGATDPSAADVTAGLTFAFDCGNGSGYGAAGSSSTASCPTSDNGTRTVKGKVIDKDGGFTEYTVASVTIANVAPTATFANDGPVNEGSTLTLSLTGASDVSSADQAAGFRYAFDCGSGYGAEGTTASVSCPTTDDGTPTVRGKVIDKDGGATEYTAVATVNNVAPTATFASPTTPVNEGSPIALELRNATDPSSVDAQSLTYAFDCGTGYVTATSSTGSCAAPDNGERTVKGKVMDKDGGFTEYTATVTVLNVAPVVSAGADVGNVNKKVPFPLAGVSFTDPGADSPWSYTVSWGDGSAVTTGTATSAGALAGLSHTWVRSGSYAVIVTVTDKDGAAHADTLTVGVINRAPVIRSMGGPYATTEGGTITFAPDVSDPDGDPVTYAWNFGDPFAAAAANVSTLAAPSHTYADDDADDLFTATLVVTDDENLASSQGSVGVTVTNVVPSITGSALGTSGVMMGGVVFPTAPQPAGTPIEVSVAFTDPGAIDTFNGSTIIWDIDALSSSSFAAPMAVTGVSNGTATFRYALPAGVYTVRATILDDDGGAATTQAGGYIVVFDPSGGFVTGGGWIDSPEGASAQFPSATGRANFGFVAKYQRGANVPTGNTEFQYQAGSLDFKSTDYQWLVVSGARAQYKGKGTIKGRAGEFQFLLTAVDAAINGGGSVDKFRIKITDATGNVVYDNGLGASEDSDSGSALRGGNISIKQ